METSQTLTGFAARQFFTSVEVAYCGELIGTLDGMAAMILGESLLNEAKAAEQTAQGIAVPSTLVHLARENLQGMSVEAYGTEVVFSWANGRKRVLMPPEYAERLGKLIHAYGSAAWQEWPSQKEFPQEWIDEALQSNRPE